LPAIFTLMLAIASEQEILEQQRLNLFLAGGSLCPLNGLENLTDGVIGGVRLTPLGVYKK
jgi:hypothetical protein